MALAEPTAVPDAGLRAPHRGHKPSGRMHSICLALIVPGLLLLLWQIATTQRWTRLIPTPHETATYMVDFVVGGIHDDAFSATAHIHLLASMQRVYGGFALAPLFALTLGILIGRVPLARKMLDPFLQVMRPIPVTAWLPLSMILFGLGARSAFALVFLGAFYPILLNTVLGVKSVDPKLLEAASMLGCRGRAQFTRVVLPAALPSIFTGLRLGPGSRLVRHRGRRDDGRAAGPRRGHHGWAHAVANRAGHLRHDHHRHRGLPVRSPRRRDRPPPAALEPDAQWLTAQPPSSTCAASRRHSRWPASRSWPSRMRA